jgi:pyrimidine operon attenuation protein / uracil phosphoribosyltransferase
MAHSTDNGKLLLSQERFALTLERLCHQLVEDWGDCAELCLVGIQLGGGRVGQRIHRRLTELSGNPNIPFGKLDITFYRDDFRAKNLSPHPNEMDFVVTDKNVLLLDDVLYTGRTIQAALSALQHYGRPKTVELLVLVDRRFNRDLPIQADYVGQIVDTLDDTYIKVRWQETHGVDEIRMIDAV